MEQDLRGLRATNIFKKNMPSPYLLIEQRHMYIKLAATKAYEGTLQLLLCLLQKDSDLT